NEMRSDGRAEAITWESRDPGEVTNPPPAPPRHQNNGGGAGHIVETSAPRRHSQEIEPLPDTEAAVALQAIKIKPAQIVELANMPCGTVEAAIADGRARPGVRDLAGWVVSLLRAHRDYGWKIVAPAHATDSSEDLRSAFARYATEQKTELRTTSGEDERQFDD